jgi:hypothetical protein
LRSRRTFERTFGVLIVAVPLLVLRPLIRGELIENVADPHHRGWFESLFVNTGLLPVHLSLAGGSPVPVVPPSRLTWLYAPKTSSNVFGVRQWAALPTWGWVLVGVLVLSPVVGFVLYRATRPIERESTGVRVADAMALAPFVVPPQAASFEPVPFDAEAVEHAAPDSRPPSAPVPLSDPLPALVGATRGHDVAPGPTAEAAPPEPFDVIPAARYSTHDRWRHEGPEPRSSRRARSSEHAPRRSGGRRQPPVQESSPASHRPSRRREQWSVRWPD